MTSDEHREVIADLDRMLANTRRTRVGLLLVHTDEVRPGAWESSVVLSETVVEQRASASREDAFELHDRLAKEWIGSRRLVRELARVTYEERRAKRLEDAKRLRRLKEQER